jgi:predicted short-subunit dehydrogenase-like oxidoreductase (DUF2520 family)
LKKLSIIGSGKVGSALGHLWHKQAVFTIGDVLNRSQGSSRLACERIGSGTALGTMNDLQAANVFMIAAPDDQITRLCKALCASSVLRRGDVVFHCSGALSSMELDSATQLGASVASVHPVKTFIDSERAASSFKGTHCAIEGGELAVSLLKPAFGAIGGRLFNIEADAKLTYHAASVFACNYLTALLEVSAQAYEQAGLDRETAMQLMQPLVQDTIDNIFEKGTQQALTGPVARGDIAMVSKQLEALTQWNAKYAELYQSLGVVALSLAQLPNRGMAPNHETLVQLLDKNTH